MSGVEKHSRRVSGKGRIESSNDRYGIRFKVALEGAGALVVSWGGEQRESLAWIEHVVFRRGRRP